MTNLECEWPVLAKEVSSDWLRLLFTFLVNSICSQSDYSLSVVIRVMSMNDDKAVMAVITCLPVSTIFNILLLVTVLCFTAGRAWVSWSLLF